MAALLVIGTAVYKKYGAWEDPSNTLSYSAPVQNSVQSINTNYTIAPQDAFVNKNFDANDNLTDRFAKTAFATYVSLQNGGMSDSDAQNNVVNSLVGATENISTPERYSIKDLKTFNSQDKGALKDYGNQFATIVQTNLAIVANNQDTYSSDISGVGDIYDTISLQLSQIKVPEALVTQHLKIVNDYVSLAQDIRDLAKYQTDPLKGMLAMKDAKDIQDNDPAVYIQISDYFKSSGILFDKTEPGYSWWAQ